MTQVIRKISGVGEIITSRHQCTNTTHHKWNSNGVCECGVSKININDGFRIKTVYFDRFGKNIGNRAPECNRLNK